MNLYDRIKAESQRCTTENGPTVTVLSPQTCGISLAGPANAGQKPEQNAPAAPAGEKMAQMSLARAREDKRQPLFSSLPPPDDSSLSLQGPQVTNGTFSPHTIDPGGKLKVRAPAPLPEDAQEQLRQRKAEMLSFVETMNWLLSRLTTPQHIASLISEWVGSRDKPTGRSIDALMDARWTLGIDAYIGDDERLWWRLPGGAVQ